MTIQADAGKTVLVVDDSKVSRMVIKAHILAVHPHWQVVEAGTGDEAVELVARSVPDYCTVDVNMPGMPGTDAAALILQAHPQVRVVLDAPVQMQRETDTLRAQAGEPGGNDLESLMALVATAWPREMPSASLRYDGQALSVAPPAGWGPGDIEAFRAQLGAAGAQVDTQADGLLTVRRGPRS